MQRAVLVPLVLVLAGCAAPRASRDAVVIPDMGVIEPVCEGPGPATMRYAAFDTASVAILVRVPGRPAVRRMVHPGGRLRVTTRQARWTLVQRTQPRTVRATLHLRVGAGIDGRPECTVHDERLTVRTRAHGP